MKESSTGKWAAWASLKTILDAVIDFEEVLRSVKWKQYSVSHGAPTHEKNISWKKFPEMARGDDALIHETTLLLPHQSQ